MEKENPEADRLTLELGSHFTRHEIVAREYAQKLADLLKADPEKGINEIVRAYNDALNDVYTDDEGQRQRGYVEAIAGGPFEAVPWAIYNAVGSAYSSFTRKQKDLALKEILEILDRRNYLEVQTTHTPGIREPLLLADIKLIRPLYWPGMDEGKKIIEEFNGDFAEIQATMMDCDGLFFPESVNSDYIVAYSFLRSDFCDFGEAYVGVANMEFLDRVVRAVCWQRFGRTNDEVEIRKGTERLMELLPVSLHERIEPLRLERGWFEKAF